MFLTEERGDFNDGVVRRVIDKAEKAQKRESKPVRREERTTSRERCKVILARTLVGAAVVAQSRLQGDLAQTHLVPAHQHHHGAPRTDRIAHQTNFLRHELIVSIDTQLGIGSFNTTVESTFTLH
ncbi:hypothetical protein J6590_086237 [Homalodisca vitripennis]|nr:hypothetical protein J6590_086237 [Homalodisca vitripennis]